MIVIVLERALAGVNLTEHRPALDRRQLAPEPNPPGLLAANVTLPPGTPDPDAPDTLTVHNVASPTLTIPGEHTADTNDDRPVTDTTFTDTTFTAVDPRLDPCAESPA